MDVFSPDIIDTATSIAEYRLKERGRTAQGNALLILTTEKSNFCHIS